MNSTMMELYQIPAETVTIKQESIKTEVIVIMQSRRLWENLLLK